ncbi:MAG: EamA family transporter [Chloroflexi bacterium]|nr:EamA family transporter [Chloroflexota bacterium]
MNWIILSLASAFAFGVVSILDKVLLMRYISNARTFLVMIGLLQIALSAIVIPFTPVFSYSFDVSAVAFVSGLLWGTSLVTMIWAMSTQDVSRVVPIASTFPVFVAIMAMLFLSESLSILHWVAIVVTVAGAAFISLNPTSPSSRVPLDSSFFLLLLGSMAFGGGQLLSKAVLDDMDVWSLYILRGAGLGTIAIALMFRPSVLPDIRRALSDVKTMSLFLTAEGATVFVGVTLSLWAISLGPVSLTSTLMSTRPLFVFVLSVLASSSVWRLLDEPLDRKTLANKLISTTMIVAGISAISLL